MNKEKSANKVRTIVYVGAFLAIAAIVAIVVAVSSANKQVTLESEKPSARSSSQKNSSSSIVPSSSDRGQSSVVDEPTKPTVKEVSFIVPVENGVTIKEYTDATVVYNKTLGVYTGHLALDIAGEGEARVFAAYDGEIESITTAYLEGTTLTVNHGNGLKTVYNSIEVADGVAVGQKVSQGDVLGVISANNRQEYKDGAHLHFEVWENGVRISPFKYLKIDEK